MTIIITFLPRDIGEIRRSGYCFGASEKTTLFEARIAAELIRRPAGATIRGQRSDSGGEIALCRYQFDFHFSPERSRGAVQGRERDRSIFWIEESMNSSPRRSHTRSHRALIHPLPFHQVMHLQRDGALERGRVHLLVQALLFQERFKTASAMLVLISCRF